MAKDYGSVLSCWENIFLAFSEAIYTSSAVAKCILQGVYTIIADAMCNKIPFHSTWRIYENIVNVSSVAAGVGAEFGNNHLSLVDTETETEVGKNIFMKLVHRAAKKGKRGHQVPGPISYLPDIFYPSYPSPLNGSQTVLVWRLSLLLCAVDCMVCRPSLLLCADSMVHRPQILWTVWSADCKFCIFMVARILSQPSLEDWGDKVISRNTHPPTPPTTNSPYIR